YDRHWQRRIRRTLGPLAEAAHPARHDSAGRQQRFGLFPPLCPPPASSASGHAVGCRRRRGAMILRRELPLGRERPGRLLPWLFALLVHAGGLCAIGCVVLEDAIAASDAALAVNWSAQLPADTSN